MFTNAADEMREEENTKIYDVKWMKINNILVFVGWILVHTEQPLFVQ